MRQAVRLLFSTLILLICATPLVLQILGIHSPNLEKRVLSARPVLVEPSGALNSQYTAELDAYIADHFPLRTYLISGWHRLNIGLFRQSGSSRVILGQDGWLFFADTATAYLGQDKLSAAEYARLNTTLRLQAEYLASRGSAFLFTVVPDKNTVYPELMPGRYDDQTEANALAGLADHIDIAHYVNLRDLLRSAGKTWAKPDESPIYLRTDSHWNNRGALLACLEILSSAGSQLGRPLTTPYQAAASQEKADWQGDLAVMLFPSGPAPELQQYYEVSQTYHYAKPVKSLEDLLLQTARDGAGGTPSLLMFRDSFANALIPMLSESFARATYSRGVPYDYGLLDSLPADVVLLEIAERNLHDWLRTPPRMPALPLLDNPVGGPVVSLPLEVAAVATPDGAWLKISGSIAGGAGDIDLLPDWSRIVVSLGGWQYEAFPAKPENGTAGFVLYLEPGRWTSGKMAMSVQVETRAGWIQVTGSLDCP